MVRHSLIRRRAGFTVVEMLVVVGIIISLMALLLPAVQKVQESARRAKATVEISQLSNAITGGFKAKFNVSYIPSRGNGPNGGFRLQQQYAVSDPELIYLKQLFPQMAYLVGPVNPSDSRYNPNGTGLPNIELDANQSLIFFLTGGSVTNYQGFSNNKAQPFTPASTGENRIGPFIDVNPSKVPDGTHFVDPWGTPYAYFTAVNGNDYSAPPSSPVSPYYSLQDPSNPESLMNPRKYYNARSFQIISAGANKAFGPGGLWYGYGGGNNGSDDVSNFNSGQLGSQSN